MTCDVCSVICDMCRVADGVCRLTFLICRDFQHPFFWGQDPSHHTFAIRLQVSSLSKSEPQTRFNFLPEMRPRALSALCDGDSANNCHASGEATVVRGFRGLGFRVVKLWLLVVCIVVVCFGCYADVCTACTVQRVE